MSNNEIRTQTINSLGYAKKTILTVRDFAIIYNIVTNELEKESKRKPKSFSSTKNKLTEKQLKLASEKLLKENQYRDDLLRIKKQLGTLNIEVETPNIEIEKE
jgi:hypothetical protein